MKMRCYFFRLGLFTTNTCSLSEFFVLAQGDDEKGELANHSVQTWAQGEGSLAGSRCCLLLLPLASPREGNAAALTQVRSYSTRCSPTQVSEGLLQSWVSSCWQQHANASTAPAVLQLPPELSQGPRTAGTETSPSPHTSNSTSPSPGSG